MEPFGYQLTLSFYKNGAPVQDYTEKKKPKDFSAKFNNHINTKLVYTKEDDTKATSFGEMNLSSLSYLKQLYSPNCIKVSIECSDDLGESMQELAKLFKEARAKLDVVKFTETVDGQGVKRKSVDDTGAKKIADEYEVYESSPKYDGKQKKMYIDLVMYSPDKVLDTFEYSKAYTNKRLGQDIFKSEADSISSKKLRLECSNMQVLRLKTGEEFSQPYLVQYNETFYSFLSRVANRCGEFLYYDDNDGKLSLGVKLIKEVTQNVYDPIKKKNEDKKIKQYKFSDSDFDKISFTEFNTSHNRGGDLEDFYSNYMVKGAKSPSKSFVKSSELSGDEYFETVTKDGFSSTDDERKFVGYGLYNVVGTIFTNVVGAGLFLAGVNIVTQNTSSASKKAKDVNKHFNEKFFKGVKDTSKRLFGSADALTSVSKTNVNVNSNFYPLVRDKEMDCNRGQVSLRINTDISKNVMLGDRIKIFGKEYVVVKVTASFDVVNSSGSTAVRQPVDVIAVPVVGAPMPTYSVEPVRKVGCQKAFVTDVDDPSFLGRVQVRFSWQKNTDDSSPWIRVCTQMANSKGGAAYFKAAVGDSVLIDFENGNADMPYVSGFLPTIDQQKNKGQYLSRHNSVVVSSEHGQMMLMSDPTTGTDFFGAGGIPLMRKVLSFLPSDKPIKTRFLGSTEFTDYYGIYSVKMSSSDRSVTINSPFGNVAMNAFTGISINAPNGDISISGKNITLSAGNNITIQSGNNALPGSTRSISDAILGAVGDLAADTAMPMILDLGYIRKVFEIFVGPCEGTLSLKSGRYLLMQAGGAEPRVPNTGFVIPGADKMNIDPDRDKITELLNALNFIEGVSRKLANCVSEMQEAVKKFNSEWSEEFFYMSAGRKSKIKNDLLTTMENYINKDGEIKSSDCELDDEYVSYYENLTFFLTNYEKDKIESELANKANKMVNRLRGVRLLMDFKVKKNNDNELEMSIDNYGTFAEKLPNYDGINKYKDAVKKALEIALSNLASSVDVKKTRRILAKAVLEQAVNLKVSGIDATAKIEDEKVCDDESWKNYVNNKFPNLGISNGDQIKASAWNAFKTTVDKLNPLQQKFGKWAQGGRKWSAERRGQILMSDTEGTTMYFNNGTLKSFSNSDLYAVRTYCKKFL